MESVSIFVYFNANIILTDEGILFECPSDAKVITISEDMSFVAFRKIIYVDDGYVEYDCVELKCDDDVGKIFSSIHNLVSKV